MRNEEMTTAEADQRIDKRSMIEIYDQHSPSLYRYAFRLLGDAEMAEDCVAETFSRFLQAATKGAVPIENVHAYLYRIAHNWATDHYRDRKPDESLDLETIPADPGDTPSSIITGKLEHERVRQALLRLTREQRQVIVLRFFEDWSHEAIGEVVGKTAEATRALQYRALAALRSMLHEQEA
jgi:RNA polymerase sigma-70 factor, ECF subfamily